MSEMMIRGEVMKQVFSDLAIFMCTMLGAYIGFLDENTVNPLNWERWMAVTAVSLALLFTTIFHFRMKRFNNGVPGCR